MPIRLIVLSVETCIVPRLALARCLPQEGSPARGSPLSTPAGATLSPVSCCEVSMPDGTRALCLAFEDTAEVLALAPGDLLLGEG